VETPTASAPVLSYYYLGSLTSFSLIRFDDTSVFLAILYLSTKCVNFCLSRSTDLWLLQRCLFSWCVRRLFIRLRVVTQLRCRV